MERKLWHVLHKVMKGEEDVNCQRCRTSVLEIPAYKCLDCNFYVHESCGQEQEGGKEVGHKLDEVHHVISTELGKHGEKEAFCLLCEKGIPPSSGKNMSIIYKCIIPKCKFLTHESCIELPVMMVDNSHDQRHPLFLNPPTWWYDCYLCKKDIGSGSFFYRCNECLYEFHITCVTRWKDKANKCNPHTYVAISRPIEFTCDVCGRKSSEMGLQCSACGLLIHTNCTQFMRDIKETGHEHPLNFTLALSQDKYHECQACQGMVNTIYGAYCCSVQECEYVFHLFCGYGIELQGGANDCNGCPPYLVGWVGDDEKAKDFDPKRHPSHPEHDLIRKNEEPKDNVCQGCKESIFVPPFYNCRECEFCLHIRCDSLPVTRPAYYAGPLSLHNEPSDVTKSFECWECERIRRGFSYRYLYYSLDIQCALIPYGFVHPLHKHQLFRDGWGRAICSACGIYPGGIRTFDCKTCGFKFCIKCLTLPLKANHKYDKHDLKLVNILEKDADENYCQICEEKIDRILWFYYCEKCDFSGHPPCILTKKT